jgi:peptidoglycan biosynthesis protein MviN/MurJ (putative lipid II flippase)
LRLPQSKGFFKNYSWVVSASAISGLTILTNFWLAGKLETGTITTWAVGNKLAQQIAGLTFSAMSAILVPYYFNLLKLKLHSRLREEFYWSLLFFSWIGGIVAVFLAIFFPPLIEIMLGNVDFSPRAEELAAVTRVGLIQLPLIATGALVSKLAVSTGSTWKVVVSGVLGLLANVAIGLFLLDTLGVIGIAVSWTAGILANTSLLLFMTRINSGLSIGETFGIILIWVMTLAIIFGLQSSSNTLIWSVIFATLLLASYQIGYFKK